jgi:hypothetical protein
MITEVPVAVLPPVLLAADLVTANLAVHGAGLAMDLALKQSVLDQP